MSGICRSRLLDPPFSDFHFSDDSPSRRYRNELTAIKVTIDPLVTKLSVRTWCVFDLLKQLKRRLGTVKVRRDTTYPEIRSSG